MPKTKKTIFQRLTRAQQKHVRECFDAPASRITITRIKATLDHQHTSGIRCFECEAIARRLEIA